MKAAKVPSTKAVREGAAAMHRRAAALQAEGGATAGVWMESLCHEAAHCVVGGAALCGAAVTYFMPWQAGLTGKRCCTRCLGRVAKKLSTEGTTKL